MYLSVMIVLGEKFYEVSNHLGNVLAVFNDVKYPISSGTAVDYFEVALVSVSDYSPFGVQLDGRTQSSNSYRYGYQGSEKDDEVKGEGNSYTTQFRQLDPRVGRWLSIDPMSRKYPNQSPYISMDDNPILKNDVLGLYGSERRAERKKAKAEKKGWSTSEITSTGEGKNKDYQFQAYIIDGKNERDVSFTASNTNRFGKKAIKKAGGWNDWASDNVEAWSIQSTENSSVTGVIIPPVLNTQQQTAGNSPLPAGYAEINLSFFSLVERVLLLESSGMIMVIGIFIIQLVEDLVLVGD